MKGGDERVRRLKVVKLFQQKKNRQKQRPIE